MPGFFIEQTGIICFLRQALCSLGWFGTSYRDQAVLQFRDTPASASPRVGLKMCVLMSGSASNIQFDLSFLRCRVYRHEDIDLS